MESKSNTNISASQRKLPYYSREEVAEHNVPNDCWVSFFGKVYDLTPLIEKHRGTYSASPPLKGPEKA